MKALADASSLIVLARQDVLWLLERVFDVVALVDGVYDEAVVQGKIRGYTDALRIERAIVSSHLVVIKPTAAEQDIANMLVRNTPALSETDCLSLACARERGLTLIMEERRGRNVAVAQAINYVTIQVLPVQAFIARQVSLVECQELLRRIGQAMHMDVALMNLFLTTITEVDRMRAGKYS